MKKGGISILGILLLGILLIIILGNFNIGIKSAVENPKAQENINYVGGAGKNLWNVYLEKPFSYIWNDVFIKIFWASFIDNMERIRDGKPTDYQNMAPTLDLK